MRKNYLRNFEHFQELVKFLFFPLRGHLKKKIQKFSEIILSFFFFSIKRACDFFVKNFKS